MQIISFILLARHKEITSITFHYFAWHQFFDPGTPVRRDLRCDRGFPLHDPVDAGPEVGDQVFPAAALCGGVSRFQTIQSFPEITHRSTFQCVPYPLPRGEGEDAAIPSHNGMGRDVRRASPAFSSPPPGWGRVRVGVGVGVPALFSPSLPPSLFPYHLPITFNMASAVSFDMAPTSFTGPTHEGQPSRQGHVMIRDSVS